MFSNPAVIIGEDAIGVLPLRRKAIAAAGKLSGPADLSDKHDDYLGERDSA